MVRECALGLRPGSKGSGLGSGKGPNGSLRVGRGFLDGETTLRVRR